MDDGQRETKRIRDRKHEDPAELTFVHRLLLLLLVVICKLDRVGRYSSFQNI